LPDKSSHFLHKTAGLKSPENFPPTPASILIDIAAHFGFFSFLW